MLRKSWYVWKNVIPMLWTTFISFASIEYILHIRFSTSGYKRNLLHLSVFTCREVDWKLFQFYYITTQSLHFYFCASIGNVEHTDRKGATHILGVIKHTKTYWRHICMRIWLLRHIAIVTGYFSLTYTYFKSWALELMFCDLISPVM